MSGLVWHWQKGDKKIFTRKVEVVKKAKQEGSNVKVLKKKPRIFKNGE